MTLKSNAFVFQRIQQTLKINAITKKKRQRKWTPGNAKSLDPENFVEMRQMQSKNVIGWTKLSMHKTDNILMNT